MSDLIPITLLRAIGWALLHSLWQGSLLALLAALLLHSTRRRSSEVRYGLASVALGLMVLSFLGTLAILARDSRTLDTPMSTLVIQVGQGSDPGWLSRVRDWFAPWMPGLVLAWLLGFGLKLLQLGQAVTWLYGPCLNGLRPAPSELEARFQALAHRCLGTTRVRLGLSDQVDSLVVLGWLKPVVLLPAAAFLALSPEALEALLIHELEHIRRSDFLANLIQTLAEALLFYHPAVWWLSRRIRQEREHCCDDAAVRASGNPLLYASALTRLEELRIHPILVPQLAPAASGGQLMSRIQRILRPQPAGAPVTPLVALAPAFLLVAVLGLATLSAADKTKAPTPVELSFDQVKVKHRPDPPPYPPEAKAAKVQGTVIVETTIDSHGKVSAAKALSGPEALQAHALAYAKTWEFEPAKLKGKPVPATFKMTLAFKLH